MGDPAAARAYNFSEATDPALSTPVILEFDHNLYFDCAHAALPPQPGQPWDTHAVTADPLLVGEATPPWERSVQDLALSPSSPAFALPGFRRIAVEAIGLGPDFAWDLASWARRGGALGQKIQAETYDRQVGLWREGSYGISPGPGNWPFQQGAWALYKRVDVVGARAVRLRVGAVGGQGLQVSLAIGTPSGVVAVLALNASAAPAGVMGSHDIALAGAPLTLSGASVFLLPQSHVVIDWFQLLN